MTGELQPYRPSAADPFDLEKASHLYRRAAFCGSLAERKQAVDEGLDATLERLFAARTGEDVESMARTATGLDDIDRLRAYRLWRMLWGPRRVAERMSYFWHGHFATAHAKVQDVGMIARQWQVFDRHGLGRFDDLLLAVSRDPAMIRWLDNETNVAGSPNENYAREIFELFALGRGHYTETDVREAARAFTGWHIRDGRFAFEPRRHDGGPKQVLGRSGVLGGEDVVALAAAHPAGARFVAGKLCAWFVHPQPEADEVAAVARAYTASGRDLGATLRQLLGSTLFFSARARGSRIKDPIDLVVGLVRSIGMRASPQQLVAAATRCGQELCDPPSVEGWHREQAWINSATWLLRANFARELFDGGYELHGADERVLGNGSAADRAARAVEVLWGGPLAEDSQASLARFVAAAGDAVMDRDLLHAVQTLPEGQLL